LSVVWIAIQRKCAEIDEALRADWWIKHEMSIFAIQMFTEWMISSN
jgi:hypothetical protein